MIRWWIVYRDERIIGWMLLAALHDRIIVERGDRVVVVERVIEKQGGKRRRKREIMREMKRGEKRRGRKTEGVGLNKNLFKTK